MRNLIITHTTRTDPRLTPTQVKNFTEPRLSAVAINSETLEAARNSTPPQDLWKEAISRRYSVILISSEQQLVPLHSRQSSTCASRPFCRRWVPSGHRVEYRLPQRICQHWVPRSWTPEATSWLAHRKHHDILKMRMGGWRHWGTGGTALWDVVDELRQEMHERLESRHKIDLAKKRASAKQRATVKRCERFARMGFPNIKHLTLRVTTSSNSGVATKSSEENITPSGHPVPAATTSSTSRRRTENPAPSDERPTKKKKQRPQPRPRIALKVVVRLLNDHCSDSKLIEL